MVCMLSMVDRGCFTLAESCGSGLRSIGGYLTCYDIETVS